ncbi:MAG: ABC transporter permease [Chryseobacterium sp.]|nr:MAG: ABC transporter permease [Chryseobacterium sp.]
MNIYWQELKFYRRSMIIWIISLCAVALLFLSMYSSLSGQIEQFRAVISNYPKALLAAINFRFEIFYSIYGFLSYIMTFVWLAGAIQATNLGISVLSKEVSGKTADFLLSKPVSRNKMLLQKFLAVFTVILVTNIVFTAFNLIGSRLFSPSTFNFKLCLLISLTLFFVQMFFLAIGYLLGAVVPKIKTVISYSLPIVFGLFILSSFSGILDKPETFYFTPFKYFDATYIFRTGHYEYKYLWVLLSLVVFCMFVSFVFYNRKDINQ